MPRFARSQKLMLDVGRRLAISRQIAGISQKQAAAAVNTSQGSWGNWETGQRLADVSKMIDFCDAYDFTLEWIYRDRIASLPAYRADEIRRRFPQVIASAARQTV